jgi:hypothetical protein
MRQVEALIRHRPTAMVLALGSAACVVTVVAPAPLLTVSAGDAPAVTTLAVQRVGSMFPPETAPGAICMFINQVQQAPGAALLHRHQAGAVYAVGGDVQLTVWQDGLAPSDAGAQSTTATLAAGDGAILPTHWWHQHANPGSSPNTWDFLAVLGGPVCTSPPASFHYVSPTVSFSDGPRLLKLYTTSYAAGDEAAQAGPAMIETLVLAGSVTLDGTTIAAGGGFFHAPGTVMHVVSSGGAELLSFSMAADG